MHSPAKYDVRLHAAGARPWWRNLVISNERE
jgi:hypothetical protein